MRAQVLRIRCLPTSEKPADLDGMLSLATAGSALFRSPKISVWWGIGAMHRQQEVIGSAGQEH